MEMENFKPNKPKCNQVYKNPIMHFKEMCILSKDGEFVKQLLTVSQWATRFYGPNKTFLSRPTDIKLNIRSSQNCKLKSLDEKKFLSWKKKKIVSVT